MVSSPTSNVQRPKSKVQRPTSKVYVLSLGPSARVSELAVLVIARHQGVDLGGFLLSESDTRNDNPRKQEKCYPSTLRWLKQCILYSHLRNPMEGLRLLATQIIQSWQCGHGVQPRCLPGAVSRRELRAARQSAIGLLVPRS